MSNWIYAAGVVFWGIVATVALGFTVLSVANWWYNRRREQKQEAALIQDASEQSSIAVIARRFETVVREQGDKQLLVLQRIADRLAAAPPEGADPHGKERLHMLHMILARLDALVEIQETGNKNFRRSMDMVFGGPGYGVVDDEEATLREQAEKLMKRYRLPYEEAIQQAKQSRVYDPNDSNGMRERV